MVSKASDDFPEPDGPVMTVNVRRGISTSNPLRLFCRAPLTTMLSFTAFNLVCGGRRPGSASPALSPLAGRRCAAACALATTWPDSAEPGRLPSKSAHISEDRIVKIDGPHPEFDVEIFFRGRTNCKGAKQNGVSCDTPSGVKERFASQSSSEKSPDQ